jgi:hypothetical protein
VSWGNCLRFGLNRQPIVLSISCNASFVQIFSIVQQIAFSVYDSIRLIFWLDQDTVHLTSIDHPEIEGAYISGLHAANFIFLVCVQSPRE